MNRCHHIKYGLRVLLILLVILPFTVKAQTVKYGKSFVDSASTFIWTGANFSYQIPFGDLATLFKGNYNIGTGFNLKTSSNWTFDINFNYMFGSNLKDESVLGDMITSQGDIIDGNGYKATLYTEGRYWTVGVGFGKIIPVSRWKNSGIWIHAGAGFLQHKIHFTDNDNQIPQLSDNYRKGYDRRSSGFCMSQFVGYLFMQRIRVASFYAGIEIYEIWTKPDRNYVFYEGATANMKNKFSGMVGLKIAWIIPLYEKKKVTTLYTY